MSYKASIVYGWKGAYECIVMPGVKDGIGIFTDRVLEEMANIPIYGCECIIESNMLVPIHKERIDREYASILQYCAEKKIEAPVLGYYAGIDGTMIWSSELIKKQIKPL